MASDAVGSERISRIVGYKIVKGDFAQVTPNLPQRIAILAEANTAEQATLDTAEKEITSAQQAGNLYGFGSPIYHIMRILRPLAGGGIGGLQERGRASCKLDVPIHHASSRRPRLIGVRKYAGNSIR